MTDTESPRPLRVLAFDNVSGLLAQHLYLVLISTVLVLVIAVPIGILLSRRSARRLQGPVLAIGGFGQALPPFGVLLLMAFAFSFGSTTAIIGLTREKTRAVESRAMGKLRGLAEAALLSDAA